MAPWWSPDSFGLALVVALVSTACWGSWSNTAKAAGDRVNFAHYYTDFCLGTVLTSVIFLLTAGARVMGGPEVNGALVLYSIAAGAVFGVANLLLTTGIALAGLSIAFPLCIGTGLVLGTVLTYIVDQRGHPELLFPGVFLALLGVLANARAYAKLQESRAKSGEGENTVTDSESSADASGESGANTSGDDAKEAPQSFKKNIIMCVFGGVLMGCWSPLSAKSMSGAQGLSPYFSFLCFVCSSMVVGICILTAQQFGCKLIPRVGSVTGLGEYFRVSPVLHAWGLLGGLIWAIGTLSNLVSGGPLGFALSYALGQTAPVVAVLWGLGWYREFNGAPQDAVLYLVAMFLLFFGAIALLCLGGM